MNVWIIGRGYPEPANKMRGSFELEQAKMLGGHGVQVSYLSAAFQLSRSNKMPGFYHWREDDIDIFSKSKPFLPPGVKFSIVRKLKNKWWADFLGQVEKQIGKPDVIHLHYPVLLVAADILKAYQDRGVKIVVTEHWSKVLAKRLDSYQLIQQKKYVDLVDTYICVGYPLKNAILEMTCSNRDIQVVPNVVNKAFAPDDLPHDGFEFICVGCLVAFKQMDKIVEAFASVFKGENEISLTVVGDGEQRAHIKTLIEKLGVGKQVKMTGSLNRGDTAKAVSKADCLVCYSSFETFGVPVIEAWASGIPAISSTACSVMESFDNRLGREVSYKDDQMLQDAMKQIYTNREKYDKEFIAEFAKNHYSEEIISRRLIDIYNGLLEK